MAEDEENPFNSFRNRPENTVENENTEAEEPIVLDLGINPSVSFDRVSSTSEGGAGTSNETPKREDNPFSFKHFLRSDSTNYQSQGARPKVYCDGRPITSISDLNLQPGVKQTRIVPEFSSALPDFVQDHLVIEQCYLEKDNSSQNGYNLDANNLPDFTPTRNNINYNRLNGESSRSVRRRNDTESNNLAIPLDLPVRPSVGFPLDLPVTEQQGSGSRSCPTSAEVSKSLPDFLTDGAVRTQNNNEEPASGQSPESEMERLRQEVELYRQQLGEQSRRAEQLQRQLEIARNKEHEYTQSLAKALEQVEESLERSNQRTATAESIITKLRQEIKSLKSEVTRVRQENELLRGEQGAAGGPGVSGLLTETHSRRLAQELRSSASSAEHSLRQLLLGVDNLRMLASTIENMNRIEDRTEHFPDLEDDAGPAL